MTLLVRCHKVGESGAYDLVVIHTHCLLLSGSPDKKKREPKLSHSLIDPSLGNLAAFLDVVICDVVMFEELRLHRVDDAIGVLDVLELNEHATLSYLS